MGTFTAQILVGSGHPNHGGMIPKHQLFLSENSEPAWILTEIATGKVLARWTPSVDYMLKDGLVLIAAGVLKNRQVLELLPRSIAKLRCLDLPEDTMKEARGRLQQAIDPEVKITVTVFRGSTISGQLAVLKRLRCDVEVCTASYVKVRSAWTGKSENLGNL